MRGKMLFLVAFLSVMAMTDSAFAQTDGDPISPPNATWAGTTDIFWDVTFLNKTPYYPKRVGILAYCADLYHNAGDTGLQADKRGVRNGLWLLDGPFKHLGQYGAQNIADYLAYDDSIDRLRDVQVIDGDLALPTSTQLINNFDIVIAYSDNKCGPTLPTNIANSAASALTGFIGAPNKKLILTGFAFSSSLGFGNGIYANGLSPLTKGGPGNAACTRGNPCLIGSCATLCPFGCTRNAQGCIDGTGADCGGCSPKAPNPGDPVECRDAANTVTCGLPTYTPLPGGDFACSEMLNNVNGPTSSSWATALTAANVGRGATLCFNYDSVATGVPFLAMNAARNIIAINAFPSDRDDIQKFWYGCLLGNAVQYLSGAIDRCAERADRLTCH